MDDCGRGGRWEEGGGGTGRGGRKEEIKVSGKAKRRKGRVKGEEKRGGGKSGSTERGEEEKGKKGDRMKGYARSVRGPSSFPHFHPQ